MSDTDDAGMFDEFADATEAKLTGFAEHIRAFRAEMATMREEQRSARVQTPAMDVVDMQEIVTRAAALVPSPENGKDGRDGANGKDATFDVDALVARVAEIAVPRVVALVPAPEKGERGEPGISGKDGEKGERGEDGLLSPEEIRSFISEDRALQWREFFMGVYRPDAEYRQGQAVTWNGSFWIATEDTRSKPETDKTWILAVKHGRDASNGRAR